MKTTQRRILWAAVVAIVLTATIVFVVLGVSGHTFTELKKKSKPQLTGSIDEIFKAVENAMNAMKEGSQYRRVFMHVTTMKYSFDKEKRTVTVLGLKDVPSGWRGDEDWRVYAQIDAIEKKTDMDEIKMEHLKGPEDAVATLFTELTQKLEKISLMTDLDPHKKYSSFSDFFFRLDPK